MDDPSTEVMQSPPTILRIKRKRTDEPLDALIVESKSRRKKSRGGSGFFQFAETVEEGTFWQDPGLTKDLRTRISTLASGEFTPEKPERDSTSPQVTPNRRYAIVKNSSENKPPPVVNTANQPKTFNEDDYTLYDAIPVSSKKTTSPVDPEMANFLPMLQEYLRMNNEPSNITSNSEKEARGGEYVWDVFYHRPAITGIVANVATISGLPSIAGQYDSESDEDSIGDEDDEDSNTEDFYRNDYPDEDPDQESENSGALSESQEEYPELSEDEDERDLDAFLAWRARR